MMAIVNLLRIKAQELSEQTPDDKLTATLYEKVIH